MRSVFCEPKNNGRPKKFRPLEFQMFLNKRFKEILNAVANRSNDNFAQRRKNFHTLKVRTIGMETTSRLFPIVRTVLSKILCGTIIAIKFVKNCGSLFQKLQLVWAGIKKK